jgi:hypothetical protein
MMNTVNNANIVLQHRCDGTMSHKCCRNMSDMYNKKIIANEVLTQMDYNNFAKFMQDSKKTNNYNYTECINAPGSDIKKVVKYFLTKFKITQKCYYYEYLIKLSEEDIIDIMVSQELIYGNNSNIIDQLIMCIFKNAYYSKLNKVTNFIIKNYFTLKDINNVKFIDNNYFKTIVIEHYELIIKLIKNEILNQILIKKFYDNIILVIYNNEIIISYVNIIKNDLNFNRLDLDQIYYTLIYENISKSCLNNNFYGNRYVVPSFSHKVILKISEFIGKDKLKQYINSKYKEIIISHKQYKSINNQINLRTNSSMQMSKKIELLLFFGLDVTKEVLLFMINNGYFIKEIDKYGIEICDDIMINCTTCRFYPYKYVKSPPTKVLEIECGYDDNYENIIYLKELGGEFNAQCLINACKTKASGKLIKFLIEKCNIKVTLDCIKKFEEANEFNGLSLLLKNYDDTKIKPVEEKIVELNNNCVMKIEKNNLKYDITDENYVFDLKKKVVNFFEFKNIKYKYVDLKLKFYEYLISNNLIIGKYFVVNNKLSKFFKINQCVIIDCNYIDNILTYFVENFYKSESLDSKKSKNNNNTEEIITENNKNIENI